MSIQPKFVICGNDSCAYRAAARMMFSKKGLRSVDIKASADDDRPEEMARLTRLVV